MVKLHKEQNKKKSDMETYVQEVKVKVEKFDEDKKNYLGGMTEEEFKEAE